MFVVLALAVPANADRLPTQPPTDTGLKQVSRVPAALTSTSRPAFVSIEGPLNPVPLITYVVPAGTTAGQVDPEIAALDVFKSLESTGSLQRSTALIFDTGTAMVSDPDQPLAAQASARQRSKPRAHTSAYSDCPAAWTCLWQYASYSGTRWQFISTGYWQNLSPYGANDAVTSWRNRRSGDSLISIDAGGGGSRMCLQDGGANAQLSSGWDNAASSIFNSAGQKC